MIIIMSQKSFNPVISMISANMIEWWWCYCCLMAAAASSSLLVAASTMTVGSSSLFHPVSGSHLTNYDRLISSSVLGEPVFRLEPPNVINYPNTKGTTLLCVASGTPKPTITWYVSPVGYDITQQSVLSDHSSGHHSQLYSMEQSKLVTNVTNFRVILQNGAAIRILPFKEADFRPDIHHAEYRCVASNPVATIHSRSALVQPRK